ncbi:MAG: hypothetical protein EZS28_022063, partial [Streblomastix strix]
QAPYPPVCVTRVTGDCVAEWEDIENERKKRNEVVIVQNTAETVERDSKGRSQLKSMLYQSQSSYGFQPRSFYGFQPRSQYGIQSFYNVVTVANTADTEKEEEENETEIDWLTDPGYSRRALVFSCVPIVRRPVRIWRVGKGNWGRCNTAPRFMNAQRQLDRKRKAQLQRQYLNRANVGSNYNKNWMFFDPDNKFISIFQVNQYIREQNVDQKQQPHLTRFQSFFGSLTPAAPSNQPSIMYPAERKVQSRSYEKSSDVSASAQNTQVNRTLASSSSSTSVVTTTTKYTSSSSTAVLNQSSSQSTAVLNQSSSQSTAVLNQSSSQSKLALSPQQQQSNIKSPPPAQTRAAAPSTTSQIANPTKSAANPVSNAAPPLIIKDNFKKKQ